MLTTVGCCTAGGCKMYSKRPSVRIWRMMLLKMKLHTQHNPSQINSGRRVGVAIKQQLSHAWTSFHNMSKMSCWMLHLMHWVRLLWIARSLLVTVALTNSTNLVMSLYIALQPLLPNASELLLHWRLVSCPMNWSWQLILCAEMSDCPPEFWPILSLAAPLATRGYLTKMQQSFNQHIGYILRWKEQER